MNDERFAQSPRSTTAHVFAIAVLLTVLPGISGVCFGQAAAQFTLDKVTLKSGASRSEIVAVGRIVDYTGIELMFRAKDGASTTTFPADQIVGVETVQTPPHVAALRDFTSGKMDDAIAGFTKALDVETRSWVRREIRAMLVRCYLQQGDRGKAALNFAEILRGDPQTMHFKLIPLLWTNETPSDDLQTVARGWLGNSSDAMRLIAASVLLNVPAQESRARIELQQLATTTDPRIYWLAEAQLWRTRLNADDLDRIELDRWTKRIEQIPIALRGGAYYVVGQGRLQLQEYERAAQSLLWVPLVYYEDDQLSAQACYEAAEALERIGQSTEARTLYRELVDRFPKTTFGEKSAEKLKSTHAPPETTQPVAPDPAAANDQ